MAEQNIALVLAQATEADLRAEFQRMQAATLRGDPREIKAVRDRAHALLDACLDRNAEWAVLLRVQLLSGG